MLERAGFPAKIWAQAEHIAEHYRIVLEQSPKHGYIGHAVEMPLVFADGKNIAVCGDSLREVLTIAVATMLESGQRPPMPASAGRRQRQLNIRLTEDENMRLEEAARQQGFRGVSDYVRFAALSRVG